METKIIKIVNDEKQLEAVVLATRLSSKNPVADKLLVRSGFGNNTRTVRLTMLEEPYESNHDPFDWNFDNLDMKTAHLAILTEYDKLRDGDSITDAGQIRFFDED